MKRKVGIFFTTLVLLAGALFVFRHSLMAFGMRSFLSKTFSEDLQVQQITAKDNHVYVYGLHVEKAGMELNIDGLEFGIQFKKILKSPKGLIRLYKEGFSNWIQLITSLKKYDMNLGVQSGVLKLDDQRYYFQMKQGKNSHEIGTLTISHDPGLGDHPFLTVQLFMRGDQLISQLALEEVPSERFLQLAQLVLPKKMGDFQDAQGLIQLRGSVVCGGGGEIYEVSTRFQCTDFCIQNPKKQLAVKMDLLKGDLNYPEGLEDPSLPVWKQMQCGLHLENGAVLYGQEFTLAQLEGSLALDPRVDPSLTLKGEVLGQEKPLALSLVGKGAVHEDHAYWLEFGLNLDDHSGTECDAFLSICRPEKESLVFQVEANHLLPQQVEMLKDYFAKSMPRLNHWQVQQGSFGGKLVALFEKGQLSHFEIQDVDCRDVSLTTENQLLFFPTIKGEGRLFDQLQIDLQLPVAHFFAFASTELRDIFSSYRPDDFAQMSMTIQFEEAKVNTSASVDFLNLGETIHFGFDSPQTFPSNLSEISSGWARSEKISHLLYGPFVRLVNEDLKLYGDIDFLASYDGQKIELSVQVDDFLAKHPYLDVKTAAIGSKEWTSSRARCMYDTVSKQFSGAVPIQKASVYDRRYGLVLEDVTADLNVDASGISGQLKRADASFDGNTLVQNLSADFSFKETSLLSNLSAKLNLPTDRQYWIRKASLSSEACTFLFDDGKQKLAQFTGKKGEHWKGQLDVSALSSPVTVDFSWDPLGGTSYCKSTCESFSCHLVKEQSDFWIKKLQFGDQDCSCKFNLSDAGIVLSDFSWKNPKVASKGSGNLWIQLPTKQTELSIKSEMDLDLDLLAPVPIHFQASEPIKAVFSPGMGLALSDIDLKAKGCSLHIPLVEYLTKNRKLTTQTSTFSIAQEVLQSFIAAKAVPDLIADFQFGKGLEGEAIISHQEGVLSLDGEIQSKTRHHHIHLDWDGERATFSVGEENPLTFEARISKQGVFFESIHGSYRNISAELKQLGKERLKGTIHFDGSAVEELFDLPLSRYLTKWKAGSGYECEGVFSPASRLADWAFKGKLKGSNFECGGFQLRSLETKLDIEPGQVTFEHFDLTDNAGKLWIEEGALMRNDGQWFFAFPLVELRGFQPSFLQRLRIPENVASPLIIKTATIENLRGTLDDLNSLSGAGNLRFANRSKTGDYRLLKHLPVSILQQLGLDEETFVPVSGEMAFTLQNKRAYLKEMRNTVSDGNRSEFIPPRTGVMGYVDFAGNLFVDMQVRQRGGRGTTPPHAFKIRGTWQEPQITIR